jgi:hypothetical protein
MHFTIETSAAHIPGGAGSHDLLTSTHVSVPGPPSQYRFDFVADLQLF